MRPLRDDQVSDIIALAWDDKVPFSAIYNQYQLTEAEVIRLMRSQLKAKSFKIWRKRVSGNKLKHC